MFDIDAIRADFPLLSLEVNDHPLVYLDSGATSQKPYVVIDTVERFYREQNANVHRGVHTLSQEATERYEAARSKAADFFGVDRRQLVWTKGATEAVNLVAFGLTGFVEPGDIILVSPLEHHANLVPWQQLAQRTGARIEALPLSADGIVNKEDAISAVRSLKPKILALTHASNALGNINPVKEIIKAARAVGAYTLIDGAQAIMHLRPNIAELDCDFYVLSAHKALGPTGVGALIGRYELLEQLPVYQTGGEMIDKVELQSSTFTPPPGKFEPGTPNISGVIGFAAAIDYLSALDGNAVRQHEMALFHYLVRELRAIEGICLYGDLDNNIGTVSFNYKQEHPYDLATLLDGYGVALRSGHHCTQPLMAHLGLSGTLRASLAFYNSRQDVDRFISALKDAIALLD